MVRYRLFSSMAAAISLTTSLVACVASKSYSSGSLNLFPYLVFEYLPEGVARQVIDEHHLAGLLEAGQVLAAEARHLLGGEAWVFAHHDGDHAFPELGVGQTDNGHLGDPWATFDHILDLAGVDIIAAADYELLGPPAYGEVAVLTDETEIPRGEPALFVEALLGRIGPVPVAGEDVRATDFDLPDLPVGQRLARLYVRRPAPPGREKAFPRCPAGARLRRGW